MIRLDAARLGVAFLIFLINLPFGFYRVRFRRFSRPWGRTIYLPILINVLTRRLILQWDWGGNSLPHSPEQSWVIYLGGFWGRKRKEEDFVLDVTVRLSDVCKATTQVEVGQ